MTAMTSNDAQQLSALPYALTPQQTAEFTGIPVAALAQDRYSHKGLPFVKIGARVRYLRDDIVEYLQQNRIDPAQSN